MGKKIAVIGAGMTGLAAAYRLAERGNCVTVYEKSYTGGLNAAFEWNGIRVDNFYRHIFTSDQYAIRLIEQMGLLDHLVWNRARMGMYVDGVQYGFETPLDLLRFSPFSLLDKVNFVWFVLNMRLRNDLENLENYAAADFIRRQFGDRLFDIVWKPLLFNKFGDRYEEISMAWLWNRVKIRSSSRGKGGVGEQLGYLMGSFALLTDALMASVEKMCGKKLQPSAVVQLAPANDKVALVTANGTETVFDQVLCTIPLPEYYKLIGREGESPIRYQGAITMVLQLKRPLTEYYWLNIADTDSPFGGIVEQTNMISPEFYGGKHIAYLTKYENPESSVYNATTEVLYEHFLTYLQSMIPDFSREDIEDFRFSKDSYAQPIVLPGYSKIMPSFQGHFPGVYIANMTHIYPEDRGINHAVRTAEKVVEFMG